MFGKANKPHYVITSKIVTTAQGNISLWGIKVYKEDTATKKICKIHIDDITDDYNKVKILADTLNKYDVDPVHMQAIVEDFLINSRI